MVRRIPSRQRNARVVRERDPGALVRFGLLLICGLVLAGGFVYAGGQHFAALKLGYETQSLRKLRTDLAQEQDRLVVEQQVVASPARLERAARQLGLQPMQAAQIDPLKRTVSSPVEKQSPAARATVAAPARIAPVKLIRPPTPARVR